jgi:hypothetical protein
MSLKISEYTTEQTTIEDTDRQELSTEIAPSIWETRWYSITNLKAKLKAYFDTLYLVAVPTLNDVLVEGNETLGTNIKVNDADAVELENTSLLKKGTYDFGASGGISRICGVGYEDMWQAGIRYVFDNMGYVREATNCFNIVPDASFDDNLRFKAGSRWILDDGTLYLCTDATSGAAVWDLIPASVQSVTGSNVDNTDPLNPIINVPTLEEVNDAGGVAATNNSKYGDVTDQLMLVGLNNIEYQDVPNGFNTVVSFEPPTAAGGTLKFPDTAGYAKILATIDQIPSGGGGIPHGTASGTDTYAVTITGPTAYNDGDAYLVRFTNGNTTSATLNINSIGAVSLYRNNDGALIGGDIIAGGEMLCIYNSTTNRFQLIGTAPNTLLAYVTNADSVSITKGMPVYAFGGTGDRMTVKRALNTSDATSARTIGIVLSTSIAANQKGLIIIQGQLDGLSIVRPADGFADGDPIYLGATAGSITNVKPSAPNHLVYLGTVTTASNGSAGRMYVRVQNGYELDEIHDVAITSVANNNVLQYESATTLWKNKALTTASVAASTDKNYVTDAQQTVIGNTSGTNSGNETTTTTGALINGATAKTTPVDADFIGLMDSAASNILKKLSWANIKATLVTYFDTLYSPIATSRNIYITTGDQSTSGTANVGITGLSITTVANKRYAFEGFFRVGCNAVGGLKFTVTAPSGSTLNVGFMGPATPNSTNGIQQFINASGTQTAALANAISTLGIIKIYGEVSTGATTGTIQVGFASAVNTQTSTVFQNGTNIIYTER